MDKIHQEKLDKMAKNIRENISEMQSVFHKISFRNEFVHSILESTDEGASDEEEITNQLQDRFRHFAKRVFDQGKVFFELQEALEHRTAYIDEISKKIESHTDLFNGKFDEGSGDEYSTFVETIWNYFLPFPEFMIDAEEEKLYLTGMSYLENILRNTATILEQMKVTPTKETDIYKAVSIVVTSTFPEHQAPDYIFQKGAQGYVPDILLPGLHTAVEYKYADSEKKLSKTMDEILVDVQGYSDHPNYDHFYAVFYTKAGAVSQDRFDVLWRERKFPRNWRPILIQGQHPVSVTASEPKDSEVI